MKWRLPGVNGINGAFASGKAAEIGSPGMIAVVPEPGTNTMLLGGLGLMGFMMRRRNK